MQAGRLGAALPLPQRNALADLLMDCLAGRTSTAAVGAALAVVRADEAVETGLVDPAVADVVRDGSLRARAWRADVATKLELYARVLGRVPFGTGRETRLAQARALFEAGLYFEVHEVLEPEWLEAEGAPKVWLQGLIQAAVALHHYEAGNLRGAGSLAVAAAEKLESAPPRWCGVRLAAVGAASRRWAAWLARGARGCEPARPDLGGEPQ